MGMHFERSIMFFLHRSATVLRANPATDDVMNQRSTSSRGIPGACVQAGSLLARAGRLPWPSLVFLTLFLPNLLCCSCRQAAGAPAPGRPSRAAGAPAPGRPTACTISNTIKKIPAGFCAALVPCLCRTCAALVPRLCRTCAALVPHLCRES